MSNSPEEKEAEAVSTQLAQPMKVEGPNTGSSVVRREPIPKELAELGVSIGVDPDSKMQLLIIPKELRAKANVLAPIQAFQQADPNWRPSLRVVELNPDAKNGPHFYPQAGGKLAPRKQALELLADAAGVVQTRTSLLGRERVEVGGVMAETFTHLAILKIRKSDGTLRTLEASRTYEPFAEYEETVDAVKNADEWANDAKTGNKKFQPDTPAFDAEVRKRWLNEIKFAKAKNESKAMNRTYRAVLQIAHTYAPERAALPFVVVGWNLAPQDSAAVQAAIAQLYGAAPGALEAGVPPRADGWDEPEELEAGEIVEDDATEASDQQAPVEADSPPAAAGAPGSQDSPGDAPTPASAPVAAPDATGDGEPQTTSTAAAPDSSPADTSDPVRDAVSEPEREPGGEAGEEGPNGSPERGLSGDPSAPITEPTIAGVSPTPAEAPIDEKTLERARAVKIPSGSYQGRTLGWVLELGDAADEWLAYALRQPWPHDESFKRALVYALRADRPALVEAWRAEG